jgi:hypothetical protein
LQREAVTVMLVLVVGVNVVVAWSFIALTVVRVWVTVVSKEPSLGWWSNEGCLKSSWTHLITPSRNFVEAQWRSLFRSTSLGKRCPSYNAPSTSRKRARSNKVRPRTFQTALVVAPPSKKGSFKTTVTQTLTTVRGMKTTPLLHYLTTTT